MKNFNSKLALVTGASSGIGQAIAVALARQGARLILVGTNESRLAESKHLCEATGAQAHPYSANVADYRLMQGLAEAVRAEHGTVDILVNNAGVVMSGLMHEVEIEDWQRLIDINVMGVVHGCKLFIPGMLEQGSGHIVNMASAAGLIGQPGMSTYCATKHAVVGLSSSLRYEVARSGVGVSTICPGYVRTPIIESLKLVGKLDTPKARAKVEKTMRGSKLTAEVVAARTLKAIRKNESFVTIGKDAQMANYGRRLSPGLLDRMFTR